MDAKYILFYLYIFFVALEEAVVPRSSAIVNKELDVSTPAVPSTALCSALTPSPAVPSTDLCLTTPNIPQKFIHQHQFTQNYKKWLKIKSSRIKNFLCLERILSDYTHL